MVVTPGEVVLVVVSRRCDSSASRMLVVVIAPAPLDVACSCWRPLFLCGHVGSLYLLFLVRATVVIVVTAGVAVVVVVVVVVVVAAPLLFFIHVDPASWLLILWPCVNR